MPETETKSASAGSPQMFSDRLTSRSDRHGQIWRHYQIAYDLNDLAAGLLFVVGSVLFYDESMQETATTLFLMGSLLFCLRPLIHVLRDFHLTRLPG